MARINKIDFFCGAFLSYIISNGVKEPTLFEASENSKRIEFSVKSKNYNIYIKYAGKSRKSKVAGKISTNWNVVFTPKENEFLKENFKKQNGYENLVVLVCANDDFKGSCFAVLKLAEVLNCIGTDKKNEERRISVKHIKGSPYLNCYGTGITDIDAIKVKYNCDEIFEFAS